MSRPRSPSSPPLALEDGGAGSQVAGPGRPSRTRQRPRLRTRSEPPPSGRGAVSRRGLEACYPAWRRRRWPGDGTPGLAPGRVGGLLGLLERGDRLVQRLQRPPVPLEVAGRLRGPDLGDRGLHPVARRRPGRRSAAAAVPSGGGRRSGGGGRRSPVGGGGGALPGPLALLDELLDAVVEVVGQHHVRAAVAVATAAPSAAAGTRPAGCSSRRPARRRACRRRTAARAGCRTAPGPGCDGQQVELLPDVGVVGHLLVHLHRAGDPPSGRAAPAPPASACPSTYDPEISAARFCRPFGVTAAVSWNRGPSCPGNWVSR